MLKDLLKDLKLSGVKYTTISKQIGVNINTLYAIASGHQISPEREEYITSLLNCLYKDELERIQAFRTNKQKEAQ